MGNEFQEKKSDNFNSEKKTVIGEKGVSINFEFELPCVPSIQPISYLIDYNS